MGRSTGIAAGRMASAGRGHAHPGTWLLTCSHPGQGACTGRLSGGPGGARQGRDSRSGGYHAGHYIWGLKRLQALPLACSTCNRRDRGQPPEAALDHRRDALRCASTQPHCSAADTAAKRLALRAKTPARARGCWTSGHGRHLGPVPHRQGVTRCSDQALGNSPGAVAHQGANRRDDQPSRCTRPGQSKPGPGSRLRPGATCSWPTTSRKG